MFGNNSDIVFGKDIDFCGLGQEVSSCLVIVVGNKNGVQLRNSKKERQSRKVKKVSFEGFVFVV